MGNNEFEDASKLSIGKNFLLAAVNWAMIGGGGLMGWHAYDLIENHTGEDSPLWAIGYSLLGGNLVIGGARSLNRQLTQLTDGK